MCRYRYRSRCKYLNPCEPAAHRPRFAGITVYATQVTTKLLQAAKREQQTHGHARAVKRIAVDEGPKVAKGEKTANCIRLRL